MKIKNRLHAAYHVLTDKRVLLLSGNSENCHIDAKSVTMYKGDVFTLFTSKTNTAPLLVLPTIEDFKYIGGDMSTVKKGMLAKAGEWAKHLRPWGKQRFWSKERIAAKNDVKTRIKEQE